MFTQSDQLDRRQYNEEMELAKALSLSAESFAKEQKQRKEQEMLEYNKHLAVLREKEKKEKEAKKEEESDPRYLECQKLERFVKLMNWDEMFVNRGVGAGLQNLGNSCFLNATLQCLAYTTPFAQILQTGNHSKNCKKKKFCELCELETFIPSMLLNGRRIHKPINLFKNLSKTSDLLTPGCQEDAHEFLQALLDKLELSYDDSYFELNNRNINFKRDPFNPIRKLFEGTTKTTVMCSKCRTVTSTEEPFSCVSLDVDPDVTLTESLSIFTHDELLRGDEKYYCLQCKRKVIARKQLTLAKLPSNLIFHFKRFKLESYSQYQKEYTMKKLCDYIEFPFELNFNTMLDLVINPLHQKDISIDSIYELYGIVVHSGPKLGYGHYYSFIKSFDNKQWFRMNDMEVLPINKIKVLKEQAYLLFYRRKTHNIIKNDINKLKVNIMIDKAKKNGKNINENDVSKLLNGNANLNGNGNIGNNTEMKINDQYHWKHQSASPTQIKSIPTNLDEKVDFNMLNDNYFVSSCGNDTSDVIAFKDKQGFCSNNNNNNNNNNNGNNGNNTKNKQFFDKTEQKQQKSGLNKNTNDRTQFVMIPPMATRSDISVFDSDGHSSNGGSDDNNGNKAIADSVRRAKMHQNTFEEVFWPTENID